MAKPLGPKSRLIRDAIAAHPSLANKELAAFINKSPARKEDGIEVTPIDVAQQKQAMKKMGFEPAAPATRRNPAGRRRSTPQHLRRRQHQRRERPRAVQWN